MLRDVINKIKDSFTNEKHIAPLAVLRMAFGAIMLFSTIRFIAKGWVYRFYVVPKFYFPFYGFEWVKPLPETGMYIVFGLMLIACFCIIIGCLYRMAITVFFISFVYVELIDKTYYLNHYYFVSIFTFLLLFVPAHRYFSVDVIRKPSLKITHVPGWVINIFKFQLCLVYFYAGISKLNHDWMIDAMPLKLWLPANGNLPVIGTFLKQTWVAYLFSWFGAVFDLFIGFFLLYKPSRKIAYAFVVIFHVFTAWFFKIGMFPYIMIFVTVIFFSEGFHLKLMYVLRSIFNRRSLQLNEVTLPLRFSSGYKRIVYPLLSVYIVLQVVVPFRFLLYPGKLFWTEEGYRFSWRVMLMEKAGTAFFLCNQSANRKKRRSSECAVLNTITGKDDGNATGYDVTVCSLFT